MCSCEGGEGVEKEVKKPPKRSGETRQESGIPEEGRRGIPEVAILLEF